MLTYVNKLNLTVKQATLSRVVLLHHFTVHYMYSQCSIFKKVLDSIRLLAYIGVGSGLVPAYYPFIVINIISTQYLIHAELNCKIKCYSIFQVAYLFIYKLCGHKNVKSNNTFQANNNLGAHFMKVAGVKNVCFNLLSRFAENVQSLRRHLARHKHFR